MIVVSDYRGYRIEVEAVAVGAAAVGVAADSVAGHARWHADVRLRRILSRDKPRIKRVTCLKLMPDLAERAGELWARRWIDSRID
jgi:hypothetical protein